MKEIQEATRILEDAYNANRTIGDGEVALSSAQWKRLISLLAGVEKKLKGE